MSEKTNVSNVAIKKHPATEGDKKQFKFIKVASIVLIVLAAALLVVGVVNIVVNSFTSKMNGPAINDAEKKVDVIGDMKMYDLDYLTTKAVYLDAKDKVVENLVDASTTIKSNEKVLNFVIAGVGKFGETDAGEADIIVLASVNKQTKAVKYIFIEKLLLTYIPTVGIGHLNDAYEWGGAPLLAKTVMHNFGIKIDGYIEMDIEACLGTVDAVGGIELSMTDAQVTALNESIVAFNERMGLTGENAVKAAVAENGKVALNGQQTVAYVRGDCKDRFEQVKNVFSQISKSLASAGLGGAIDCLDVVSSSMTVYVEKGDFTDMVKIGLGIFDSANFVDGVGGTQNYELPSDFRPIVTWDYAAERAIIENAIFGE